MEKEKDNQLVDAITETPVEFSVGDSHFCLYPKTLGVSMLVDNLKRQLGINEDNMKINATLECLRICEESKDVVCRIVALNTMRGKDEVRDMALIRERQRFFMENLSNDGLATLLLHSLRNEQVQVGAISKEFGIDKETMRKDRLASFRSRNINNSVHVGGKSIYGTLIAHFAKEYGWTFDYILWGISYVNLMLMYHDKQEYVFLSEKERKEVPRWLLNDEKAMRAEDPETMKKIKQMNWR